jgi:tRNA-specific 2-thiouridylase
MKKKVVVAMSGGVDSSVAAALLQREGYDCIGVFMRLGSDPTDLTERDLEEIACSPEKRAAHEKAIAAQKTSGPSKAHHQGCCSTSDAADARYVAGLLGIPFYALNFQHDFGGIIDYFVREYNRGRTPNPCVRCNEYLKFGKLSRYAKAVGAEFVATGHYARIEHEEGGEPQLMRGLDVKKDQSYALFGVPREELARMLLPIGGMEKHEVRRIAEELKLPVFDKPDSQEICFVPDNDYAALVKKKTPELVRVGSFVDPSGKVLGEHEGHQHFTIGQRRGTGMALGYPIYVTGIDAEKNTVTLGGKAELLHRTVVAREVNWIVGEVKGPGELLRCRAKIRYRSQPTPATALVTGEDELTVRFDEPIAGIAPGQAVVCYAEGSERVLGGGWIDDVRE